MVRIAGLLAGLALVAWLGCSALRDPTRSAEAAGPQSASPVAPRDLKRAELVRPGAAPRPEQEQAERREVAEAEPPAEQRTAAAQRALHTVEFLLLRGDGQRLEPASVQLVLTRESDGQQVTFSARDSHRVSGAIEAGVWKLEASAHEARHVPVWLDFSSPDLARANADDSRPAFRERVYLWPELWIPIIVRTPDGRPFTELAREHGLEPRRLFSRAFEALATYEDVADPRLDAARVDAPAQFERPRTTWNYGLPGSIVGSLRIVEPRPFWVWLTIYGVPHERRFLEAGDTELIFELDFEALAERFASVTLRLVDRDSGSPVLEAEATLKADNSSHRRHDLQEVAPDETGRIRFDEVIPGTHDLLITRGGNFVQRKLELAPGEHLDLGPVAIGGGPALPVRVVDANGEPVQAVIEIAPYERGRAVADLYHPNLHRTTDAEGHYALPLPDQISIVRARPLYFRSPNRNYHTIGTRNIVVDPAFPPGELVLVARLPVSVHFEPQLPWGADHSLTVENGELGLTIARIDRLEKSVDLVPGPYVIRHWEGDRELGTVELSIGPGTTTVRVP